jgi:hypothetical protein
MERRRLAGVSPLNMNLAGFPIEAGLIPYFGL